MNGGHPVEVNLNITLRLSPELEHQIERLISVLVTATHEYGDSNEDEILDDD